ncbi:MAG: TolC family protein [Rikenellaceae bacterium]
MKNITKILGATLICSALCSGCGLYTKYQRPEVIDGAESSATAAKLYDTSVAQSVKGGESIATMGWRELFTDGNLQQLIELGVKNNTDLNVARLNVEQANVALRTARLAYLPSLSLDGNGRVYNYREATYKTYEIAATASWQIDIFGKVRNEKEQSRAAAEQTVAYRQAIETELIASVANSYYTLLMLDEQLDISRRTAKNWDDNLRVMEALKRAGRVNETAVLQTASSRTALSRSIVSIEAQIEQMELSLSTTLGVAPQQIKRGEFVAPALPQKVSIGLPLELLNNRPDVRAAEYNLSKMFYATAVARSSMYPTIVLSGGAGFTNSSGAIMNPGDMLYEVLGSLTQPLFNRGALKGQLEISKSQQEQALLEFKQALLDAGNEVNQALVELNSSKEQLKYDKEQMAILERAVRGTELLMRNGSANYLEVLTAQISLLQSELNATSNKFGEVQSVINLYKSLGGGASK